MRQHNLQPIADAHYAVVEVSSHTFKILRDGLLDTVSVVPSRAFWGTERDFRKSLLRAGLSKDASRYSGEDLEPFHHWTSCRAPLSFPNLIDSIDYLNFYQYRPGTALVAKSHYSEFGSPSSIQSYDELRSLDEHTSL